MVKDLSRDKLLKLEKSVIFARRSAEMIRSGKSGKRKGFLQVSKQVHFEKLLKRL